MKVITKAKSSLLNKLYNGLAPIWNKSGNCLDTTMVKVLKPTARRGRTLLQLRIDMTKETFHKYVTHWFDEGVNLSVIKNNAEFKQMIESGDFSIGRTDEETLKKERIGLLVKGIRAAFKRKELLVMGGYASGNNTMGEVYAIYDMKTNEILTMTSSNFASDDSCGD